MNLTADAVQGARSVTVENSAGFAPGQLVKLDEDDYTAVTRLRARRPSADVWLARVGQPTAYKLRRHP